MRTLLGHLRGNAIAYLALFVALSGTTYAAVALPKNSVGTKQLKRNAVSGAKVKRNTLGGKHIREGRLGQVPLAARALTADNATNAANAANAASLGGQPASAYLTQGATAANATTLGGQPASAFLGAAAKAADADKWDGIDASVFGTQQSIAGVAFEPRGDGSDKDYSGQGGVTCTTSEDFHYRLQLPQGALLTRLDYRFVDDNASTSDIEIETFEIDAESNLVDSVGIVTSEGDEPGRRGTTAAIDPPVAVDNTRFSYQLTWSPFACGATMVLVGARVHYVMPTG